MFTKAIPDDQHEIFASVCHDFESILGEFDGEDDYVHLLGHYPPKVSVLVNSLKGVSSRLIQNNRILKHCGEDRSGPQATLPNVSAGPLSG